MAKKNKIAAKIAARNLTKTKEETVKSQDRYYRFDFIGKSKFIIIVSTVFIIVGFVFFFARGFNFGIDFRGGNLMEVQFNKNVSITELRNTMEEIGYGKAILQSTASDRYIIRTMQLTDEEKSMFLDKLDNKIGITKPLIQDRQVDAGFSKTITRYSLYAIAISIAGILIYIWIRFAIRFALIAIMELIHDLLIILSLYAITYREINTTTIAVILTILGYSLSDAIVVFDRIREQLRSGKTGIFPDLVNYSINKIMVRSLSTTVTTLFPIIVLLIVGNETLKDFAFGLFIGVISGTYSSIIVGPPVLVAWNKRFPAYKK